MKHIFEKSKYYKHKFALGGDVEKFVIPHIGATPTYELSEAEPKFAKGGEVGKLRHFQYIDIQRVPNGLKLILNEEGKEYLKEEKDSSESDKFAELFNDVQGNTEYQFHYDGGAMGFGLTEAPMITDGYFYDDGNEFTDKGNEKNSEVFAFLDYQVVSPLDILEKDGEVIFSEVKGESSSSSIDEIKNLFEERKDKKDRKHWETKDRRIRIDEKHNGKFSVEITEANGDFAKTFHLLEYEVFDNVEDAFKFAGKHIHGKFEKGGYFIPNESILLKFADFEDGTMVTLLKFVDSRKNKRQGDFIVNCVTMSDGKEVSNYETLLLAEKAFDELVDEQKKVHPFIRIHTTENFRHKLF